MPNVEPQYWRWKRQFIEVLNCHNGTLQVSLGRHTVFRALDGHERSGMPDINHAS